MAGVNERLGTRENIVTALTRVKDEIHVCANIEAAICPKTDINVDSETEDYSLISGYPFKTVWHRVCYDDLKKSKKVVFKNTYKNE